MIPRRGLGTIRTGAVFLALLLWPFVAAAQPKTDVITLGNGDHFTGEIVTLDRGRLELKTDDAGTIEIEWDKIARVTSVRLFDIETSNGRRLLGSFQPPAADRNLLISGSEGGVELPMALVTHIAPIGASFWKKLDGSLDAGFSYTRSSEVAQTTVNSDTRFRRPAFEFRLTSSGTLTHRTDDEEPDDRGAIEFSYVRYRGRWFVSGASRFENNASLGLELRSQIGGLIGVRPVNTNRAQLSLGGGIVVNNERGVDTDDTKNVEGALTLTQSFYSYDRPKTNLDVSFQYYPSLSHWGRQRLQLDTAVRRELWKDFYASLNLFDTFDSDPPNPDAARNDVGVVVSVGWSY